MGIDAEAHGKKLLDESRLSDAVEPNSKYQVANFVEINRNCSLPMVRTAGQAICTTAKKKTGGRKSHLTMKKMTNA